MISFPPLGFAEEGRELGDEMEEGQNLGLEPGNG